MKRLLIVWVWVIPSLIFGQGAGDLMFVSFDADTDDGFAFVTLVDLANGTVLRFNDREWDGTAFTGGAETPATWTNDTGGVISAGTVISVTTSSASLGTISNGMSLSNDSEGLYMFIGTDVNTPTTFITAITNNSFSAATGVLTNTGLTVGVNATEFTTSEDVMIYINNTSCNSTVANCAAALANTSNWATQSGTGTDESTDGTFPDYPADMCGVTFGVTTYYSLATGVWDINTSWSLSSDGSTGAVAAGVWPGRGDNVVILNTHTITINSVDDNMSCGISADDLGRSNIGNGGDPFTGSGDLMFYHVGDILISNGGTLSCSEELMIEGYTLVEDGGTLTMTDDITNLGYLELSSTSTFTTNDDLILTGNSVTIMDNTSSGTDDLYIEWTDATLCGEGAYSLGGGGGATIQYFNTATDAQICSAFTVECPTMDCTGVPASGTGTFISGNTGPGGVGDQNSNQLWLRANDLSLSDGASVTSWSDVSGNSLSATATGVGGTEPTFNTNTVNTSLPSMSFDEGDYLDLGQPAGLDFVPGTDSWSFFIVYSMSNAAEQGTLFAKADGAGGNRTYQYTVDDSGGAERYFSSFIGGNNTTGTGADVSAVGTWFVSSHSNNTATRDSWTNEGTNHTADAIGTNTTGAVDVLIGARRATAPSTSFGFPYTGSIAEIAMYDGEATEAQRIIITNYLAAKYDIDISASGNDVYDMDDNGNGDFDFEVAGVGQASDATNHLDAIGGVARMWNPDDLDNSEYLMWGHDNTALSSTTSAVGTAVDGTVIQERLQRIWRVAESGGDVGGVSISINFSGLSEDPLGSNLRLMIDRDGDGFADNDVTPLEGSVSNDIAVFSNINFQDGDRFTLGNTDQSIPLPIELIAFAAKPMIDHVMINWTTGSELNNDFFSIEKSINAAEWSEIMTLPGSGTTSKTTSYEAIDRKPISGFSYYRLKQTDFDGQYSHSKVSLVQFQSDIEKMSVSPNPSSDIFYVKSGISLAPNRVALFDIGGQRILDKFSFDEFGLIVDLSGLDDGIYLLKIVGNSNPSSVIRLIKK